MKTHRWVILLVVGMMAVFAGTGQAVEIYANSVVSSNLGFFDGVGNLTGAPDGKYATFNSGDLVVVGFAESFALGSGSNVMVYVDDPRWGNPDLSYLKVYASADGSAWGSMLTPLGLTNDAASGGFWFWYWVDDAEAYGGTGAGYNYVMLDYDCPTLYVDAVGAQPGAPIPEPGTMMLLGSGLVGLAGWGRKKLRK